MGKTIIKNISTRTSDDETKAEAVSTQLTIDFSNVTIDEVYEIAAQSEVIKWQGNARRGKSIPAVATRMVVKPGTRGAAVVDYAAALVKLLGGDKTMLLLKKYGSAEAAYTAIKPMLDAMMEDMEAAG